MARKIYYKILHDGTNQISDKSWDDVLRLQHWYNSEFVWTAGKLSFKMYAVFQGARQAHLNYGDWNRIITRRREECRRQGMSENEVVRQLESEHLIISKTGGYADGCLASGFTRVAGNEFNAYLAVEFLLKVSHLTPHSVIAVEDEGEFIKSKIVHLRRGSVMIPVVEPLKAAICENMIEHRHVFAIVDSAKYNQFPKFRSSIPEFGDMSKEEQHTILAEWNWLGFESNYDINGDDIQGYDLSNKVVSFSLNRFGEVG